jgi:peptidylprolyl isomerase
MRKKSIIQIVVLLAVCAGLVALLAMWFDAQQPKSELLLNEEGQLETLDGPLSPEALEDTTSQEIQNTMNPKAVFTTNKGVFELELFEDQMPITVGNFVTLAEDGYYNGTKFHRVIDGFMIQGGDPNSKGDDTASYGTGGPGYTIQDEFVSAPNLSNVRGTISMANTGQPNSGGSQFFINTVDNLPLDFDKQPLTSKHPVFGHVVSGMDVVDAISSVETGPRDLPVEPVVIESVTIVRN